MIPELQCENIGKYCRTCLNEFSSTMFEIFEECHNSDNSTTIAEMICVCTSISVLKDDLLPKKICDSCFNCLVSFYRFRRQVEKVDLALKSCIESKEFKVKTTAVGIKLEDCHINNNSDDEFNNVEDVKDEQSELAVEQTFPVLDSPICVDKTVRKYKCNICDKKFRKMTTFETHSAKHKKQTYSCSFCIETFIQKHKLVKHLLQHTQDKREAFDGNTHQEVHQSTECDICSATFKSIYSLSAHMRVHVNKGRILSCRHCEKVFKKMSHLKRHEQCHEINRPYKCNLCPKSFISEALLSEHTNRHCGIKPHACPLCSKTFSNISTLTTHLKVHTREKAYLCSTCGKKFDSSTNLNQHMKRHLGLKLFACNLCPRSFISKGELKSHSITHTGEKFYSCDQCAASFTMRSSLSKHKLRHLGIKPYKCENCSMKFISKDHLKRHHRIHTGEKPYRCEICERAFTQSGDLVKHRRAHLGDKLYRCTQCSESFRLQTELRQHISEHYISSKLQAISVDESPENNNKPERSETVLAKEATDMTDVGSNVPIELMAMQKDPI